MMPIIFIETASEFSMATLLCLSGSSTGDKMATKRTDGAMIEGGAGQPLNGSRYRLLTWTMSAALSPNHIFDYY